MTTYCDCEVGQCEGGDAERCAFRVIKELEAKLADALEALASQRKECAELMDLERIASEWAADNRAEIVRLREAIRCLWAAWTLMGMEKSGPSWPRDRYESWLDNAAELAGIEMRQHSKKELEAILRAALDSGEE